MNEDQLRGTWNELKGKVREQWAELTQDDVSEVNGNWEQLVGKLQTRYGLAKEQAAKDVNSWLEKINKELDKTK